MRITIAAVGKIKEAYLASGIAEYAKRLAPFCRLDIAEVPEERVPGNPSPAEKTKALTQEGERLLRHVRQDSFVFVLDVVGPMLSSEAFAARLATLALAGRSDLTFVIGGPFGLGSNLLARADERLSLSRMTFTHQMTRLIMLEQIYRAFKINRGEPYHW